MEKIDLQRRVNREILKGRTISLVVSTHYWLIMIEVIILIITAYGIRDMRSSTFEVSGMLLWLMINFVALYIFFYAWQEAAKLNIWMDDTGKARGHSIDTSQGRIEAYIAQIKDSNRTASQSKTPSGRDQVL